ncbi:unnamed protein product [Prorocentrum cordatum]|uniref:Ionotropic glutamate receptor C-terminal domain-containing protein n=1 Tax=Prorocentrum cordatum TaxID=2364126 RepID=A0ABN9S0E5_9DINO|nr:unnamed protein product [Polarella glacialis]
MAGPSSPAGPRRDGGGGLLGARPAARGAPAWLPVGIALCCWRPCCGADEVRFGMPLASYPPYVYFDNDTAEWSGFARAVISAIAAELDVHAVLVPDPAFPNISALSAGIFDVTILELTHQAAYDPGMELYYKVSYPWFSATTGAMVRRTETQYGGWKLFEPFEGDLWIAIVALTFAVSGVLVILMGLAGLTDGQRGIGLTSHGTAKAVYHAWAALLGGEDCEWHDWPGRTLRLGVLFAVLVLSSTYTANLASFFTRPSTRVHGPIDRATLRDATACVLPDDPLQAIVQPYVKDIVSPSAGMEYQAQRQWCHAALQEGQASVWIDDMGSLSEWLLKHCDSVALVNTIALAPRRLAFVASHEKRSIVANLSQAIIKLESTPAWIELQRDSFGWGSSCGTTISSASDTTPITFESMGGLFLITGTITVTAAIAGCGEAASKGSRRKICVEQEASEERHGRTDGEMLRTLIGKIDRLRTQADPESRRRCSRGDEAAFEGENSRPPGYDMPETES